MAAKPKWLDEQVRGDVRRRSRALEEQAKAVRAEGRASARACAADAAERDKAASEAASEARGSCSVERNAAYERARAEWRECRANVTEARATARVKAREQCNALHTRAMTRAQELLTAARDERREARANQLAERRGAERSAPRRSRAEAAEESADELRYNIEAQAPELLPYWDWLGKRGQAAILKDTGRSGRATAFERFLERAAEDSDGVQQALSEAMERELQAQQANEVPF